MNAASTAAQARSLAAPPREAGLARQDERPLLGALRAREPAAMEQLVRAQGPRLLAVARRMLGNEADARDAVQDAFLSAFRSLDRFKGDSGIATWLHRIVINAALMKLRSRRRRPEESLDGLLPVFLEDGHHASPPSDWPAADALVATREMQHLVRSCIDRLPEAYRSVLYLRDIEELDTEETAQALGLTPGAVKIRLHRARQALRTLLDPLLHQGASC